MLKILKEFPQDPTLSIYVIDDVWDYMKAMKVCLCNLSRYVNIREDVEQSGSLSF